MSQPVADALKERFSDWIDKRTGLGIAKYGEPLSTFNSRSAVLDMTEEILDFAQYQHQTIMEVSDVLESMVYHLRGDDACPILCVGGPG